MITYLTYSVHRIANFPPWFFVEMAGDISSNAHRTRHPFPMITAMGGSWDTRCVWSLFIFIKEIWTVFFLSTQQSWGFVTKDRNRIIPAVWDHFYRPLFVGLFIYYVHLNLLTLFLTVIWSRSNENIFNMRALCTKMFEFDEYFDFSIFF
jgi:hypothetical protein